jgi:hypothetical protein
MCQESLARCPLSKKDLVCVVSCVSSFVVLWTMMLARLCCFGELRKKSFKWGIL